MVHKLPAQRPYVAVLFGLIPLPVGLFPIPYRSPLSVVPTLSHRAALVYSDDTPLLHFHPPFRDALCKQQQQAPAQGCFSFAGLLGSPRLGPVSLVLRARCHSPHPFPLPLHGGCHCHPWSCHGAGLPLPCGFSGPLLGPLPPANNYTKLDRYTANCRLRVMACRRLQPDSIHCNCGVCPTPCVTQSARQLCHAPRPTATTPVRLRKGPWPYHF